MSLTHDETMLPGDDEAMTMRGIAVGSSTNTGRPLSFHGINSTGTIEVECVTGNDTLPGGSAFARDPDYKVLGAIHGQTMSTISVGRFCHCGEMWTQPVVGGDGYWIHRHSTATGIPTFEWTNTPTSYFGKMVGLVLDDTLGRIFILPWRI